MLQFDRIWAYFTGAQQEMGDDGSPPLGSVVGSHTKAIRASLWQEGGLQSHPPAKIREVCHHPADLDTHLPTIETISP